MKYTEQHKLADVINDHFQTILVVSRFGIPLGFGDKTVKSVCQEYGVDSKTFLVVLNYMANGDLSGLENVSVMAMVKFLRLSHQYYLEFFFPQLRERLKNALSDANDKLGEMIVSFFDNFVSTVRKHLNHEEVAVLCNIERMCNNEKLESDFSIERYTQKHEQIDHTIQDLKNIIIKYYPDNGNVNSISSVLYDIFSCEVDLKMHCDIEDNIFAPVVEMFEKQQIEA